MTDERPLEKVFLIDDEPDILTVAELSLSKVGGFKVDAFTDSESALKHAEENKPDLIILDIMMPGIDGVGSLRLFRSGQTLNDVPVIFMTAKYEPNEIRRYHEAGAIGVIQKPFDPMTLSLEVMKIWEKEHD